MSATSSSVSQEQTTVEVLPVPIPMTDQQALAKAQSIWGPNVSLSRDFSIGFWEKNQVFALVWSQDKAHCRTVASAFSYGSDPAVTWEAMFAKGAL